MESVRQYLQWLSKLHAEAKRLEALDHPSAWHRMCDVQAEDHYLLETLDNLRPCKQTMVLCLETGQEIVIGATERQRQQLREEIVARQYDEYCSGRPEYSLSLCEY